MKYSVHLAVGPVTFRVGSSWRQPIAALCDLYRSYPLADAVADYTVRLQPPAAWRQWVRPSVAVAGDYELPGAVPLPLAHGLLAAEMGMNLQLALGERRWLLLHAASLERDGRALILTGESGAGKSTLAALLGENGWRFMGDEFALIEPATGLAWPFPRPVSLKNESIAVVAAHVSEDRFGPLLNDTPKGAIRHLRPRADAIASMGNPAQPALILFPSYGLPPALRPVPPSESFVRLTQASTNYVAMAERGFEALRALVTGVPSVAIDYPDHASAQALIEQLWAEL